MSSNRTKPLGKTVAQRTYLHVQSFDQLVAQDLERLARAEALAGVRRGEQYNVVKLEPDLRRLSLLHYGQFFEAPFPSLREVWTVDLETGAVRYRTYADSLNPPILHRKELLLPADHPRYREDAAITEAAEAIGLFDDPSRIGFHSTWQASIQAKGYQLIGDRFIPLGNDESEVARELLFRVADPEAIATACRQTVEQGLGWLVEGESLQLHTSLVERLPPLLRVYVGCAALLYGDPLNADLVKIHLRSGKLTLLYFDDFENQPLPRLLERLKIRFRQQGFDHFRYGDDYEPPFLFHKSRYINEEFPHYPEQLAFDEALEQLPWLNLSGYGPAPAEFLQTLERHRWAVDGFKLVRSRTIPDLDASCGRYLRYRQLIECGETQSRTGLPNLPREPDSYTALHDLAITILDPVIDYFGMIELTYGFCSPELARHIPGRIAPALDQHAAHERNAKGKAVCPRLGAAVDFMVTDENMREVADWIAANTPFDRLYYYGPERPLHVSYGPDHSGQFFEMIESRSGRLTPRVRRINR